jgi:hypothetical protein
MHTRSRRAKRHGIESKCIKQRGIDLYASGSKDVASTPHARRSRNCHLTHMRRPECMSKRVVEVVIYN